MSVVRALCLAAIGVVMASSAASAAECSPLAGSWVTDQTDAAGGPLGSLAIRRGSRFDWFDDAPGGLFAPPFVVRTNDGQEAHGGCVMAPGGVGVDLVMGPQPLSSAIPGNEIYAFHPGDTPAHDSLEVSGTSYHRL